MATKPHPKNIKKVKSLILKENPSTQRFIASKLSMSSGTVEQDVLFRDKSRFNTQSNSRQLFIWEESEKRYHPANITVVDRFGRSLYGKE
ncbi:hypothetical protein TNCV_2865411 [Trichonephila clavipes]|nr:hypothetical protein TNCV_2865411 [Trichonephila clavipes]